MLPGIAYSTLPTLSLLNILPLNGDKVVQVKATIDNTALLTASGKVWVGGINTYGQRGDGTVANSNVFGQVVGLNNVIKIAGGMTSSTFFAIVDDGVPNTKAYLWGKGESGKISGVAVGDYKSTPVVLNTKGCDVIDFAETMNSIVILCSDGALLTQGTNNYGLLGLGYSNLAAVIDVPTRIPHEERFQRVYCSQLHCVAWASSGWSLGYSWGLNK
jgi:alpha-tubulin suppressor-like RCC1 family protein